MKLLIAATLVVMSTQAMAGNSVWLRYDFDANRPGSTAQQGPYSSVDKCQKAAKSKQLDYNRFYCSIGSKWNYNLERSLGW